MPTTDEAATAVPEFSGGTHFPCLDAYRGIGMTMVLLNHAAYATGFLHRSWLSPYLARLDLSVPMFFVMSGFLLYRPFAKNALLGQMAPPTRLFYRRRALRIFPAYWVALAGLGVVFGLQIASALDWIGNGLLLAGFGIPVQVCDDVGTCRVAFGITQAWSIGVEAAFYLALPIYAMGIARFIAGRSRSATIIGLLGGLATVYALGTAFRAFVVITEPAWAEQSLLWLPMFVDLFAIGMALAVLSAIVSTGQAMPRPLGWLGDHPWVCWLIAAGIFLGVTRLSIPDRPFGLNGSEYIVRQFAYGIAAAAWLWPAIFGDQSTSVLRRILASRPLVYLGAISLSFYLWHLNIIEKVKEWTIPNYDEIRDRALHPRPGNALDAVGVFQGNYAKVVVIAWALSFLVASVLFRFVELPVLRLKDEPLSALFRRKPRSLDPRLNREGVDDTPPPIV